ncbi:hypothetical protein [Asticcacaulis sp. W401b]|uniref:hypothetical protein n=1 Tax=Asticcacaulis sp. W401b TaxID=3388666 RepID=UPI0039710DE7
MQPAQAEQLRQESETFDLNKRQAAAWFQLRLVTGYVAVVLFIGVALTCVTVIFGRFPESVQSCAMVALVLDVLGLVGVSVKLILSPGSAGQLAPITAYTASPRP